TLALGAALPVAAAAAAADAPITVPMHLVDANGVGREVGTVAITQTQYGVVFTPALEGLPPGLHGFHVHEKPDCGPDVKDGKPGAALKAGAHLDPAKTGHHSTPWGDGHLGDLPGLYVDADGKAAYAVLAPRLKLSDVHGRSLMVHAGGDNHADHPAPLGGGGARVACGVIP
ncbi:MAG TPA: superoxide dismutase [Cu-Zn] SodC, partial [Nannocystaceae bacterium]|nr:superoxide dismutase [Cu-Zn] SodC [Nannocystaceae bacterium]